MAVKPFSQDILTRIIRVHWGGPIIMIAIEFERGSKETPDIKLMLTSKWFELDKDDSIPPIADKYYDPPKIAEPIKEGEYAWNWPTYDVTKIENVDNTFEVIDRGSYYAYDMLSGVTVTDLVIPISGVMVPFSIDYTGDNSAPPPGTERVIFPWQINGYMQTIDGIYEGDNSFIPELFRIDRSHMEGEIFQVNKREGNVVAFLNINKAAAKYSKANDGDPFEEFEFILSVGKFEAKAHESMKIGLNVGMYVGRQEFPVDNENVPLNPNDKLVASGDGMSDIQEDSFEDGYFKVKVNLKDQEIDVEDFAMVRAP